MDHDTLHVLMAEAAIRAQLHNYCRAMDRRDNELGYAVWHADGTADYGAGVFQGSGRGFVDHVSRAHLKYTVHSHQIATIGIHVVADRAVSEAYATVRLRSASREGFTERVYVGLADTLIGGHTAMDGGPSITDCGFSTSTRPTAPSASVDHAKAAETRPTRRTRSSVGSGPEPTRDVATPAHPDIDETRRRVIRM